MVWVDPSSTASDFGMYSKSKRPKQFPFEQSGVLASLVSHESFLYCPGRIFGATLFRRDLLKEAW